MRNFPSQCLLTLLCAALPMTLVADTADADASSSGLVMAEDQLGFDVYGQDGSEIGDISDFALDLRQGTVAYVLIASGETLGLGGEVRALPSVMLDWTGERYEATITEPEFQKLPTLPDEPARFFSTQEKLDELARRLDAEPGTFQARDLKLLTALNGVDANLKERENFGGIRDVALNPTTGVVGFLQVVVGDLAAGSVAHDDDPVEILMFPVSDIARIADNGIHFDLTVEEARQAGGIYAVDDLDVERGQRGRVFSRDG